jgi:transcriptional regulator with XRE-family HTH domain
MSQEALGDRAQLHRTYVGSVERGERNPSFESLSRLLGALGVSWTEFGRSLDKG